MPRSSRVRISPDDDLPVALRSAIADGASIIELDGIYRTTERAVVDLSARGGDVALVGTPGTTIVRQREGATGAGDTISQNSILFATASWSTSFSAGDVDAGSDVVSVERPSAELWDIVRLESADAYRRGPYRCSHVSRVVEVGPGFIRLADVVPFAMSQPTVKVWRNRRRLTVEGVACEWMGAGPYPTCGIVGQWSHGLRILDCKLLGATGAGAWIRYALEPTLAHVRIESAKDSIGHDYGTQFDGVMRGSITTSKIYALRHAVGFTGDPSQLCRVESTDLISAGLADARSFNAHNAESVDVVDCTLNEGAQFAGGHFAFRQCRIASSASAAGGMFRRRSGVEFGSLTVEGCKLAFATREGTRLLYNLAATVPIEDIGDLRFTGNDVTATGQIAMFWGLGFAKPPRSCGVWEIADNRWHGLYRPLFECSGALTAPIEKPGLLIVDENTVDGAAIGGLGLYLFDRVRVRRLLRATADDVPAYHTPSVTWRDGSRWLVEDVEGPVDVGGIT